MVGKSGFTLIELLIAVLIMALGFVAMSQMQFLSFRQKNLANDGIHATNIIQFVADSDIAEIKKRHLLNSFIYLKGLSDSVNPQPENHPFCDGTAPGSCPNPPCTDPCIDCPCDPFTVIISDATNDGLTETTCSAIDLEDFDPDKLQFGPVANCSANCPVGTECMYLLRRVTASFIDNPFDSDEIEVTITYGTKNQKQINDTATQNNLDLKHTLASQNFQLSGHVATNWNQFVTNWDEVNIPHVP